MKPTQSLSCPPPNLRVKPTGKTVLQVQHSFIKRLMACALGLTLCSMQAAEKAPKTSAVVPANSPASFAPVATNHPLANVWNDPEFVRQLLGSYGFMSEVEPRMTAEEQIYYREKIVPLLRDDAARAIPELQFRVKPDASAVFDFTLGNVYFQNENLTNAIRNFEQATAKFPNYRRAWKMLGFALVRDNRHAEAIAPLAKAVSLGEANGPTFGLLGFSYLSGNKFVSAEAAYKQAALFEPDNLDYKLGLVKAQIGQANYDGALALLDEMLQSHPERDVLWSIQANVFLQKNQPAKAAVNFEVLRRLGKATPENLATLGDIYLLEETRDLALAAYLESIEKDGWQKPARALRAAEILVGRGAFFEATELFKKIRAIAGSNLASDDELKLLKLEAKVAMSTGTGETAIMVLEKITERNPLDGEALILAGDYYARIGEVEKAEFRYDAAAKISGFEADALVKQAQLNVKAAKYTQAVESLKKAQQLKPRDNVQRYLERVEQIALARRS
jgi:Flp pilus assembly protein TadD